MSTAALARRCAIGALTTLALFGGCSQPATRVTQANVPATLPPADAALPAKSVPPAAAAPAVASARLISREDFVADLASLRDVLVTLHPGIYRYLTPEAFEQIFELERNRAPSSMRLEDAYLRLARLVARIQCGHTLVSPYNQKPDVTRELFETKRLPLLFEQISNKVIVTKNFTDYYQLGPGAQLLSIAGEPITDLLAEIATFVSADGGRAVARLQRLVASDMEPHAPFDILLPLLRPGLAAQSEIVVEVRPAGESKTVALTVNWHTFAQRQTAAVHQEPGPNDPLWSLRFEGSGSDLVGILTMPTWVAYKTKWPWQDALHQSMGELVKRNARALIVDLRGNGGGNDVGDIILSHMIDKNVVARVNHRMVRFRKVPERLRPLLDTWDDSFFKLGVAAIDRSGQLMLPAPKDNNGELVPVQPQFKGKLFVLVDQHNTSATFAFAQTVKRLGIGKLIGAPTGGNQRGINGGAIFFARLPKTGMEVDVPLIAYLPTELFSNLGGIPDAGIEPDMRFDSVPIDLAKGRDFVLQAALGVAQGDPTKVRRTP